MSRYKELWLEAPSTIRCWRYRRRRKARSEGFLERSRPVKSKSASHLHKTFLLNWWYYSKKWQKLIELLDPELNCEDLGDPAFANPQPHEAATSSEGLDNAAGAEDEKYDGYEYDSSDHEDEQTRVDTGMGMASSSKSTRMQSRKKQGTSSFVHDGLGPEGFKYQYLCLSTPSVLHGHRYRLDRIGRNHHR